MPRAWKRLSLPAVLVLLLALSAPATAAPPPQLVGSPSLHLPQTLEVVAAGRDHFAAWIKPPAPAPDPNAPIPLVPGGFTPTGEIFAYEIRRTGPDASSRYHHFMHVETAPPGRYDLTMASQGADGTTQAVVPVDVASSRVHGFVLYPPALIQQSVSLRLRPPAPYLIAYVRFSSPSSVTWRATVAIEHESGTRWYLSKQADSKRRHVLDPYTVDTGAVYLNLLDKLDAIRQAIRSGMRFRVVVTVTARSGGNRRHVQRIAYPWRPTTRPSCTLVLGPSYLCTFPPGITGG
ncbi:MAG: hypothetical protein ACTHOE_04900 [Conexibacter sp.]